MGPEFVSEIREVVTALENDEEVKVVVFESAVEQRLLNHSDFLANFEDFGEYAARSDRPGAAVAPQPCRAPDARSVGRWRARCRARVRKRQRALALACGRPASREPQKALLSQLGSRRAPRRRGRAVADAHGSSDGDAPSKCLARHPRRFCRALTAMSTVSLPDAELDDFVDALATRIASFDKWAIANTKRLVNEASLPPDVEIRAGWDACMTSVKRPAAQERIRALLEQGLEEPGDLQQRLGFHLGQLGRNGER